MLLEEAKKILNNRGYILTESQFEDDEYDFRVEIAYQEISEKLMNGELDFNWKRGCCYNSKNHTLYCEYVNDCKRTNVKVVFKDKAYTNEIDHVEVSGNEYSVDEFITMANEGIFEQIDL